MLDLRSEIVSFHPKKFRAGNPNNSFGQIQIAASEAWLGKWIT
jgi:hypothetical protein